MTKNLDPALLAPIEKIARFIETGDKAFLSAFAKEGVVIIENFPPHLFQGSDAVERWSQKIISWHEPPSDLVLKHSFGTVQDLRVDEDEGLAFLSVATHHLIVSHLMIMVFSYESSEQLNPSCLVCDYFFVKVGG